MGFWFNRCVQSGTTKPTNQMTTLDKLKNQRDWIAHIDDERDLGNGYIVALKHPFCFVADPNCGVRGFDTFLEMKTGTIKSSVYQKTK
jgi:hypothetical protein